MPKAGLESGAFAERARLPEDLGAGCDCFQGGGVGGAVVDDEDLRQVLPDLPNQTADVPGLIETGNQDLALLRCDHVPGG